MIAKRAVAVLAILVAIAVSACTSPLMTASGNGSQTGTLRVSLNGGASARTLTPSAPAFTKYVVTFAAPAGAMAPDPLTITNAYTTDPIALEAGDWAVLVKAYATFNDEEVVVAEGSTSVRVESGKDAVASVDVSPMISGPDGGFSYSIDIPRGLRADSYDMRMVPYGGGDWPIKLIDQAIDTDQGPVTLGDTVTCPPGYYTFVVKLKDSASGQVATRMEMVHVYSGTTTTGNFAFTADDFVPVVRLSGTASVKFNGTTAQSVKIKASLYNYSWSDTIGSCDLNADGTWSIELDAMSTPTRIYLIAQADHEGQTIQRLFDKSCMVGSEGVSDISLELDLARIKLSGTMAVTLDGTPYDFSSGGYCDVSAYTATGDQLGLGRRDAVTGDWSFYIDSLSEDTEISFMASVFAGKINRNVQLATTRIVKDADISSIGLGTLRFMTLSGPAIAVTHNTAPIDGPRTLYITCDDSGDYYNSSLGELNGLTGPWEKVIPAPDDGTSIYFYIRASGYEGYSDTTVQADDSAHANLQLTLEVNDYTIEGTMDGGGLADPTGGDWMLRVLDKDPATLGSVYELYGYSVDYGDIGADGSWSLSIPTGYAAQDLWLCAIKIAGDGECIADAYYLPSAQRFSANTTPETLVALDLSTMTRFSLCTISGTVAPGAIALEPASYLIYASSEATISEASILGGATATATGTGHAGSWSMSIPKSTEDGPIFFVIQVRTANRRVAYISKEPIFAGSADKAGIELILSDMDEFDIRN